jgi:hypothetical protein
MKWKAKELPMFGDEKIEKEFLIFPMKYQGYWYWLQWADIQYAWIGHRWTKFGEIINVYE